MVYRLSFFTVTFVSKGDSIIEIITLVEKVRKQVEFVIEAVDKGIIMVEQIWQIFPNIEQEKIVGELQLMCTWIKYSFKNKTIRDYAQQIEHSLIWKTLRASIDALGTFHRYVQCVPTFQQFVV